MSEALNSWMDGYQRAWESNDPADIRALFTEDAEYRTRPQAEPWRGQDEIVAGWIEHRDEPGDATFEWDTVAVTHGTAVVRGVTDYADGDRYHNLWVIEMADDGRARSFTEWWMVETK